MLYRIGADAVMLLHFGFILFVAAGAVLTWRWPKLMWAHLPALAWGVGTVAIGFPCPLTWAEQELRTLGGAGGYDGGFVDHYIEDVLYPDEYAFVLRSLAVVIVVVGYIGRGRRIGAEGYSVRGSGSDAGALP
ncbi:MAG: DUF2784 domain-containing protein [Actinomycetota bacterium]|nr:DUF2784 domain-containing protein [Actinomycetota bacterium]